MAAARMDLCLFLRFDGILPISPLERFERHEIEVEAFCEFRGAWIFHECDGALAGFRDVGSWKAFAMETT